ncbi:importin subunit alpha-1-like protein [Trifolium pratense]|uniref:Importin subunit alpha-1-like protein n=1 Tax=Trifolium pratense TaxID=57577 RepID=A0A2K3L4S5_TRIPR|nr:importin subunit alpha-1-like protein [Trifolium pratense]
MLRNATWTLSNFCKGRPQPAFELLRPALPVLQRLILSGDPEVLADACWALSYLSDGTNYKIQEIIEAGLCNRLVQLLQDPSASVLIPALRTVGNIVTGDDTQTQLMINLGVLHCLLRLLTHNHEKSIKKEACWTISNITAGTKEQIQMIEDSEGMEKIENLQYCDSPEIYFKAVKLLETFWLEDEMILPPGYDDQFGFKASVPSGGFNFN